MKSITEVKIGKVFYHPDLIKVKVLGRIPKSRTKVEVQVVDRGKGWDEKSQSYKGVKYPNGWGRHQNREYGHKDVIDFRTLV